MLLLSWLAANVSSQAAPVSWTGATSATWTDNANWSPSAPTNNLTSDVAVFSSASYSNQPNYGTASVNGLQFGDGTTATDALSLTGTQLSLGGSGISMLGNSGPVSIAGGLRIGANQNFDNDSSSLLSISAPITNVGNSTAYRITLNGSGAGGVELSGVISNGGVTGTTGLTVNSPGSGINTVSGNNTFTGGVTLTNGVLRATTLAAALGNSTLSLAGGELQLANDTALAFARNTTVTGNTTIISDRLTSGVGVTQSLGSLTIGSQTLTIGKGSNVSSGTAGVSFASSSTITGNATFSVGSGSSLTLAGFIVNPTTSNAAVTLSGSAFTLTGSLTNNLSSVLTINNNFDMGGLSRTIETSQTINVAGTISGPQAVTKSGTGVLVYSAAQTYTGTTLVNGGTLRFSGVNNALSLSSQWDVRTGTSVDLNGTTQTVAVSGSSLNNASIVGIAGSQLVISAPTSITFVGTGNSTISVPVAFSGSSLNIQVTNIGDQLTIQGATSDVSSTSPTAIGKIGLGTLVLSGSSTRAGSTTVTAGTLRVTNGSALGNGVSTLSPNFASTIVDIAGTLDLSGNLSVNERIRLNGGTLINSSSGTTSVVENGVSYLNITAVGSGYTSAPTVTISGGGGSGATAVGSLSAGTVNLITSTAGSGYSSAPTVAFSGGGGSGAAATAVMTAIVLGNTGSGTTTSTIGGSGNFTIKSGIASGGAGTSALTKTGSGALALEGVNTYTGTTTVSSGSLILNGTGSLAGALTINGTTAVFRNNSSTNYAGALTFTQGTLGGTNLNGSLGGVTINANRILSPGNSPGTAATTSQTWGTQGSYLWEINNATGTAGMASGWDLLSGSATLTISATNASPFNILVTSLTALDVAGQVPNFSSGSNYQWLIADFANAVSGFAADKFSINTSAFQNTFTGTFAVALGDSAGIGGDNSQVYLTYTIPEPGTVAMICIAGLVILGRAATQRRSGTNGRGRRI